MSEHFKIHFGDPIPMSAVDHALHAARSALTVAGGRVALAQRHVAHHADCDGAAQQLASVPEHLAYANDAITRLAEAATVCEARAVIPCPDQVVTLTENGV